MKKLLSTIASPLSLGIFLTLTLVYYSFTYYVSRSSQIEVIDHDPILSTIQRFDQISNDFRMQSRGFLNTKDSKVGLLTVDEKAIKVVGRWPWPRNIIAESIQNAVDLGAKVISSDMIFAEPSARPEKKLIDKISSKHTIPPYLQKSFQQELKNLDPDKQFATTIGKVSNNFILGTIFEGADTRVDEAPNGYIAICLDMVFENTNAFQIWDNEEVLLVANEPVEYFFPDEIKELYLTHLDKIRSEIVSQSTQPNTKAGRYALKHKIYSEQEKFCATSFLNTDENGAYLDPIYEMVAGHWKDLKSEIDSIEHDKFEHWVEELKKSYMQSAVPQTIYWDMNIDELSANGKHTGYFNAIQDKDGTIRKSPLIIRTGTRYFPSISLKAFLVAYNYNANINLAPSPYNPMVKTVRSITITDNETGNEVFDVPVNERGQLTINYAGAQKMYPHVSLADMLDKVSTEMEVDLVQFDSKINQYISKKVKVNKKEFMKDRIFVLGATAIGIYDLRVTPFEENFPGAETHVNVVDNLITRNFLKKHPKEETAMLGVLLVLGILQSIALTKLGALNGLLFSGGVIFLTAIIDRQFIYGNGYVTSIIFPIMQTLFIYVSMTFYKYFTEERNKRELRSTFSKYVSPAIVDEILEDPDNIELGGRKEHITVFFSDVRGFTTISEKLDPRALTDLLNSYLTPMTDLVFKNQGTLDKYMGDAVMAFFGAPIHFPDHAKHACRCALESLVKLKELQKQYEEQGLPTIDIGIGLNTGECNVGNMGSETVRNYTVMGDAVNLGSRLEGINKQYGTRIIISEYTYEEVKDTFVCREIDLVRVKGKILPVKIYELVAEKKPPEHMKNVLNHFNDGYQLYHQKEFQLALDKFNAALEEKSDDMVSQLYKQRCEDYCAEPPPDDWDGVFVMKTK